MSLVSEIVEELRGIYDGDAWHGPSLRGTLAGVTAAQADARPVANGHSIWELVLHVAAWEGVVVSRLEGVRADEPEEGDFPAHADADERAWARDLAALDESHARLLKAVSSLTDEALDGRVVGQNYSTAFMLRGLVCHNVYHAGQIALLKKGVKASAGPAA